MLSSFIGVRPSKISRQCIKTATLAICRGKCNIHILWKFGGVVICHVIVLNILYDTIYSIQHDESFLARHTSQKKSSHLLSLENVLFCWEFLLKGCGHILHATFESTSFAPKKSISPLFLLWNFWSKSLAKSRDLTEKHKIYFDHEYFSHSWARYGYNWNTT